MIKKKTLFAVGCPILGGAPTPYFILGALMLRLSNLIYKDAERLASRIDGTHLKITVEVLKRGTGRG